MSRRNTKSDQNKPRHRIMTIWGSVAAISLLAGCDDSGKFALPGTGSSPASSVAAPAGPTVERDVEAPEVFSVTDEGLWDGRPSLGGVWVAHPDVEDPERVIIRNQSNDKFVVGALFRRERDIPGPSLQISSDAAVALGILAGAPAKLNVTALRKVEEVSTDTEAAQPVAAPVDEAPTVSTTSLDPAVETGVAPVEVATAPAAPAPRPVQASDLDKPYIQIGIFSVEANAERAAKQMRGAGLAPSVRQSEINGKTFWRVVVGPAATSAERTKILSTIKAEGFTDAYAVSS